MTDIKQNIIKNLEIIKSTLGSNNKFLVDINSSVEELITAVDTLLQFCEQSKQNLSIQINQVDSGNKKIDELRNIEAKLQERISLLESELETLKANSNTDKAQGDAQLNEQIVKLEEKIASITAEKEQIDREKEQITQQRNTAMKDIEKLKNDLNDINILVEGIKNSVADTNISELYQKILNKIRGILDKINAFHSQQGNSSKGGRRRRTRRKYSTKKIKRGVKKGMIMKGGYIADYKPKTHRRQKHKKRSSSYSRRGKKNRYTTSTSRLTTTSSY